MYDTPERPLDPPEGREIGGHEWTAAFTCSIGDEGIEVSVTAEVTRDDELDPDSIQAVIQHAFTEPSGQKRIVPVDISNVLNDMHRKQIANHFETHFGNIYGDCND